MADNNRDETCLSLPDDRSRSSYCTNFMIDAHTHLTDEVFNEDIPDVIERAKMNCVTAALVMAERVNDFSPVLELYKRFPKFVVPCLGVHPIQPTGCLDEKGIPENRSVTKEDYETVEEYITQHAKVLGAIGEIGLDFTPRFCKKEDDKENQKWVLTQQVKLAQRLNLPVNVHSRSAGKHVIALLKELGASQVLLHAFDGKASTAMEGVSCGFYFSVTAAICRDPQMQKMVKILPLDYLMLETDSPAIGPQKGERNEPKNVVISCEHIARIKKLDMEEVKRITTENALKIFPKLKDYVTL